MAIGSATGRNGGECRTHFSTHFPGAQWPVTATGHLSRHSGKFGTLEGTRTPSLLFRRQALYPLSYEGVRKHAPGSIAGSACAIRAARAVARRAGVSRPKPSPQSSIATCVVGPGQACRRSREKADSHLSPPVPIGRSMVVWNQYRSNGRKSGTMAVRVARSSFLAHEVKRGYGMRLERIGTALLLAATVLVAISILLDGTGARLFNGVAGLTWFAAAAMLCAVAWRRSRRPMVWVTVGLLTGAVAFVVKPSDFLPAIIGFGLAGAIVAWVARRDGVLWARVIVGLYLPFHIGTAVLKAIYRSVSGAEASIRTDPPPTAALVPLTMLLAAVLWSLSCGTGLEQEA